jgi:glutaminyl-tRNA synthetase
VKDPATGAVVELRCSYDPETRSGSPASGRKVKATLHWVSARHAIAGEVRLYDRLFMVEDPDAGKDGDWLATLNPDALTTLTDCRLEPSLAAAGAGARFQFERQGYFCVDPDSTPGKPSSTTVTPATPGRRSAGPGAEPPHAPRIRRCGSRARGASRLCPFALSTARATPVDPVGGLGPSGMRAGGWKKARPF